MAKAVQVERLSKQYGDVTAVKEVSFSIDAGKIVGLLGRNGAGKTTIMHMLTAQWFPTQGTIQVFGEDPYENQEVLKQICFVKESQKYPENYRVMDVMDVASLFFPQWDADLAQQLIDDFGLPLKRRVKKLSRGMLSAVGIVVGLASRAPLTIFDEPYLGLDAVARSLFYDRLIADHMKHPRTVILSTHLIDEVSKILEHVLVIDKGNILFDEEADTLRGKGFTITGPAEAVDQFVQGKHVLDIQSLGGIRTASILGELTDPERKQLSAQHLEVGSISLQQLLIDLTKSKGEG